jgi:hypothetical protein
MRASRARRFAAKWGLAGGNNGRQVVARRPWKQPVEGVGNGASAGPCATPGGRGSVRAAVNPGSAGASPSPESLRMAKPGGRGSVRAGRDEDSRAKVSAPLTRPAGDLSPAGRGDEDSRAKVSAPLTRPAGDLSPAGRGDNQWPAPQAVPALGDGPALGAGLPTSPAERPQVSSPGNGRQPADDRASAHVVRCACAPSPDGKKGATVVDHVRLFPIRPGVRWAYRVHKQILPSLKRANIAVRWTDLTVWHTGYLDPEVETRKLDRNIRLLKFEVEERPDDPFVQFNLGMSAVERRELPEALGYPKRSLAGSAPTDSFVRRLFALIVRTPDIGRFQGRTGHVRPGARADARGCGTLVPQGDRASAPRRIIRGRAVLAVDLHAGAS